MGNDGLIGFRSLVFLKKMSYQRAEYEDKNLKKNSFSGRLLTLELNKLDSQKDQVSKQFRHEKDQLRRQLAEGEQIIKSKSLDPDDIRPLSSVDLKKLSPKFARRFSALTRLESTTFLPQISKCETSKHNNGSQMGPVASKPQANGRRRCSIPPIITVYESIEYDSGGKGSQKKRNFEGKLPQRRGSTCTVKETEVISGRINEFLGKLNNEVQEKRVEEFRCKK